MDVKLNPDSNQPQPGSSVSSRQELDVKPSRQILAILDAVVGAAPRLMQPSELEQCLTSLVAQLGHATQVDRVYIFENHSDAAGTSLTRQRFKWVATEADSSYGGIEPWDVLLLDVGLQRWVEELGSDHVLHGHVRDFPPNERRLLSAQNVLSVLLVPVAVYGTWWGFIGFDTWRAERDWSPTVIRTLRKAADVVGAALENTHAHEEKQSRARHLVALQEASRTIGSTLDQDKVLRLALERLCALFEAPRAVAYLADMEEDRAILCVTAGTLRSTGAAAASLELRSSVTGQVIITGRPVFVEKGLRTQAPAAGVSSFAALAENMQAELGSGDTGNAAGAARAKAAAFVPLAVGEHVLGTLNLAFDHPREFSDDDRRLLIAIGSQAGMAQANARLFQDVAAAEREARRRSEQLAALHEIGKAISGNLEPVAVYTCIVEQAAGLLKCHGAHLFLWDLALEEAQRVASFTPGTTVSPGPNALNQRFNTSGSALLNEIRLTRTPVAIADTDSDLRVLPVRPMLPNAAALLALPLISHNQITGLLFLVDDTGARHWRRDEITIATQLSAQAAVAIENARLFEAEQNSRQTAEALQLIAHIVNSSLSLDQALHLLLEQLVNLVPYDSAAVFLQENEMLRVAAARGFPDAEAITGLGIGKTSNELLKQAIETRKTLVLTDAQKDERFESWDGTHYARGWIGVPLLVGSELVGVLSIDSRKAGAYDDESARLAQALADHTAVAIYRARLVEDLQHANRELRELDELKGQFIQNVAHELRTPLTLVRGYIELSAEGMLDKEMQQDVLEKALNHTLNLVHQVESITTLQDLSLGELNLQPVNLADLASMALQVVSQKATRAGINLRSDCPPHIAPIMGDFSWLLQALHQLLDNAIKFSPDGGTVTVQLRDDLAERELEIVVEDQGIGVPAKEQQRIFDLFYQADGKTTRRFGGSGLGLAIVQRSVQAHGGRVWVDSAPDEEGGGRTVGSRFVIRLPRTE